MERDYSHEGYNIHVAVRAFAVTTPRLLGRPHVAFTALVTITKSGTRTPVLARLHLSERDGKRFPSEAETLLAASATGRRAVDGLLRSESLQRKSAC